MFEHLFISLVPLLGGIVAPKALNRFYLTLVTIAFISHSSQSLLSHTRHNRFYLTLVTIAFISHSSQSLLSHTRHNRFYLTLVTTRPISYLHQTSSVLTHYQTTNFRLFQTVRVCRRQFQI